MTDSISRFSKQSINKLSRNSQMSLCRNKSHKFIHIFSISEEIYAIIQVSTQLYLYIHCNF